MSDRFPGEDTTAANLMTGYPYVGDTSMGDLADMTFYLERLGPIEYDMADDTVGFFPATVTVGAETWEVLLPEDSTARLQAPDDEGWTHTDGTPAPGPCETDCVACP